MAHYFCKNVRQSNAFNLMLDKMTDATMDANPHLDRVVIRARCENHLLRAMNRLVAERGSDAVTASGLQAAFADACARFWRGLRMTEAKHPEYFHRKYLA